MINTMNYLILRHPWKSHCANQEMKRPSGLKKSAEMAKKAKTDEAEEATLTFQGDGSDFGDVKEMFLQAEEASCTFFLIWW